jgi:hypothetical protein
MAKFHLEFPVRADLGTSGVEIFGTVADFNISIHSKI